MKKLNAKSVARVLHSAGRPLGWHDLVEALFLDRARDRRDLRRLLTGMVRDGELGRDHQGAYHMPEAADLQTGLLERAGRELRFAGRTLARERGSRLRPGDEVEARVVGDEVRVLRVLARSAEPLIGILHTHARYPHVESLSPEYRGHISLAEVPDEARGGDTVAVRILDEDRRGLVGQVVSVVVRGGGVAQAAPLYILKFLSAIYHLPFF